MTNNELIARLRHNGTHEWGQRASAFEHTRYSEPVASTSRRRCPCCKKRATHRGMANGMGLMTGCEWRVARWVKGGPLALRARHGEGEGA